MLYIVRLFNFVDICLDVPFHKFQRLVAFSSHLIDVFWSMLNHLRFGCQIFFPFFAS